MASIPARTVASRRATAARPTRANGATRGARDGGVRVRGGSGVVWMWFEPGAAGDARATASSVFRLNVTAAPDGKLSGWMRTRWNLTVRGHVDPEGEGAFVVEAAFVEWGAPRGALRRRRTVERDATSGWFSATGGAGSDAVVAGVGHERDVRDVSER